MHFEGSLDSLAQSGPNGLGVDHWAYAPQVGLYIPPQVRLSNFNAIKCYYGPVDTGIAMAGSLGNDDHCDEGQRDCIMWWRGKRLVMDFNQPRIAQLGEVPRNFTLITTNPLLNSAGGESSGSMGASTLYYVYMNPDGVVRASATSPVYTWGGVRVLSYLGQGKNWLFIGYVRTNSSTEFEDNTTNRLVVNWYNRVRKNILLQPAYNDNNAATSYTVSNTSWAAVNGGTGATGSYIANGADAVSFTAVSTADPGAGAQIAIGIGDDSTTTAYSEAVSPSSARMNGGCTMAKVASEGYHTVSLLALRSSANGTMYADDGRNGGATDPRLTFLEGVVIV